MRLANAQISSAEIPIEHQIAAERAANLSRAQQQMGFAKAAAALLTGIAPHVQDTYTQAANADASYAKGLGDQAQQAINQQASGDNAFLSKMGTPQAGLVKPADVGGTAYGLEGFIPATSLQREGAAYGSAAQMLPGDVLAQGNQAATGTLANDPNLVKLQSDLANLAATKPAVYQKTLAQLQEMAYKKGELGLAAQRVLQGQERLNLSRQSLNSLNSYRGAELGLRQQSLNSENAYRQAQLGMDSQRIKQAWARIGISNKSLQLRAQAAEAKLHAAKSGGGGGFTANELKTIKQQSYADAQADFSGKDSKGNNTPQGRLSFKQAFKRQILNDIPASIALQELKGAGYKVPPHYTKLQKVLTGLAFGSAITGRAQQTIISLAHEYMGTPYVWGGESPKGFDCSGFAQYLYAKAGINIPRTTYTQWQAGRPIKQGQLRPGDLVFFKGSDSVGGLPGHVGIYIGNGQMIDAPHTGADVRIDNIASFGGYMGARRYGKG